MTKLQCLPLSILVVKHFSDERKWKGHISQSQFDLKQKQPKKKKAIPSKRPKQIHSSLSIVLRDEKTCPRFDIQQTPQWRQNVLVYIVES